jgi:hypothetical protein
MMAPTSQVQQASAPHVAHSPKPNAHTHVSLFNATHRNERVCERTILVCWRAAPPGEQHGGRRHLRLLRWIGRVEA